MDKRSIFSIVLCVVVLAVGVVLLNKNKQQSDQAESSAQEQVKPAEDVAAPDSKGDSSASDIVVKTAQEEVPEDMPIIEIEEVSGIPASLTVVMGEGEKNNYFVRIKAVHKLGKTLSWSEINTLYALLNRKKGEDKLSLEQLNAIKNDVLNVLRRQTSLPRNLEQNLMAMYYDKEHDKVWRDYCIQHLGQVYKKSGYKSHIAKALWSGTREKQLSIAGTSLIALTDNIGGEHIDARVVASVALELSKDPTCGELAKITALQICAKLGEKGVLPVAREIAIGGGSVPLRMSAIAAVGTIGEESDKAMLERYAKSSDSRLRKSAQSALKRLGK